jgi:hypothetical protein
VARSNLQRAARRARVSVDRSDSVEVEVDGEALRLDRGRTRVSASYRNDVSYWEEELKTLPALYSKAGVDKG